MTGAVDLAARVAAGATTAVSITEDTIRAADAAADLNAFISLDESSVRKRAADVDAGGSGPLLGVPIALKDLIDHEGRVTTCGSGFYRESAVRSATVVERIERAGGIVIGRTGLHEFAFGFSSENDWFGPVRNPWDPGTSAGGSSGG